MFAWLLNSNACFAAGLDGRPNIVVIVTDDAGYSDFGFSAASMGVETDVRTPNIDALASQSVLMTSAYASGPLCSPSRAGFLTGRYQQRIGYEDNPGDFDGLPAGEQLVSHHLQQLGYTTGAIGKWHLGEIDNVNRPLDMGFDEFFGFLGGGRPYWGGYGDNGRQIRRGDSYVEDQWVNEGDTTRYDPVRGRYLTDAFGEEAADFITRHAAEENPFFLYVALNAPHTPLHAKQSDVDQFSNIADPKRRAVAAMVYAADRAVGDITAALAENGLDDNTIVVFMNDNGGASAEVAPYNNRRLRGNKGSLWEGGIRVPMLMRAPGLDAGMYDKAVVSRDLVPTFINAAGGNAGAGDFDGADLMPFLGGESAGEPHDTMFWRSTGGRFAVRQGDWKLVRPGPFPYVGLHNLSTDVHEDVMLNSQNSALVSELLRELTHWEATLQKAKWGALGASRNQFDHFVFRNNVAATLDWDTSNAWIQGGSSTTATMVGDDAYANAILEFTVRDNANYVSTNNMYRMTGQTFMLNQLRFTGAFTGAAGRTGTINGNSLLFVKNHDGQLPKLQLDATANNAGPRFKFALNTELQLLDDLAIDGNGTQEFVIGADIRDFDEPRAVIKSGTSSVTLAGNNTNGGGLIINDGRVITSNVSGVVKNNGGRFAPGPTLGIAATGGFVQHGGVLEIDLGGTGRGVQYDSLRAAGDVSLGGVLQVSLVNGFVPQGNETFNILDWTGTLSGAFAYIQLPALAGHLAWNTDLLYSHGMLSVATADVPGDLNKDQSSDAADYVAWRKFQTDFVQWHTHFGQVGAGGTAPGDLNGDNIVNTADYVVWRKMNGEFDDWRRYFGHEYGTPQLPNADFNGDGQINAADYVWWRKSGGWNAEYAEWMRVFGAGSAQSGHGSNANVPEPTLPMLLALLGVCAIPGLRRRRNLA